MLDDSRGAQVPASHLDSGDAAMRGHPGASLETDLVDRLPLLARRPRSRAIRLTLSLLTVITALAATALVRSASGYGTFVFSILGVAVVAWIGGMAHAFPATVLLAFVSDYLWMEPRFTLRIVRPGEAVTLAAFVVVALLIGALVDALRRLEARWRAQAVEVARSYQRQTALMAEAERAKVDAESANGAKTQFLTLMSHELRTPLNAIIGYEELLREGITGPVTEAQRTQLRRIKASATHLLELISEILTLSKIEAGKETVTIEDVDVGEMLEEVVSQIRPLAVQKPVQVRVGPCERGLTVSTDRLKIKQVLLNLASNAVKFTDRGPSSCGPSAMRALC
jgi:signal transduction histidine kinase